MAEIYRSLKKTIPMSDEKKTEEVIDKDIIFLMQNLTNKNREIVARLLIKWYNQGVKLGISLAEK